MESRRRNREAIQRRAVCQEHRRVAGSFDWETFLEGREGRLRGIVGGLIRAGRGSATPDRVDEIYQETLLRMLSSRPFARTASGRSVEEVEAYFRRVVRAVLVDGLRRSTALKRGATRVTEECGLEEWVEDPSADPEQKLLLVESRKRLGRKLQEALPQGCSKRNRELLDRVVFDSERACDLVRESRDDWTFGAAYIALHRMRRAVAAKGKEALLN